MERIHIKVGNLAYKKSRLFCSMIRPKAIVSALCVDLRAYFFLTGLQYAIILDDFPSSVGMFG